MPSDFDLSTWPRWALIAAAALGMCVTGAMGTYIGLTVFDHEQRLIRLEALDIKEDIHAIKSSVEDVKRDVAVLKSRGSQ